MANMKILIGVTSSASYILVKGQINYLTSNGHQVFFVSSYSEDIQKKVESEGGIYLPIEMEREINPLKDIRAILKIWSSLRKINPDILNVSTPKAGLLFTIAARACRGARASKIVFTLRGLRSDTLGGFKKRIVKLMEKISCTLADKIIVISPSLKEHAVNIGILQESKAVVIGKGSSNGVDLNRFTRTDQTRKFAKQFRNDHNILENSIVFGYAGRLVNDKGIHELYDAFIKIKEKYNNVHLLLVGSYNEADSISSELLNKIQNNGKIILLEHTKNIVNLFAVMDVFVLFSYREGFGNVAIEAAAMELPVIVADIPGLRDTIEDKKTGLLALPKSRIDLEAKMEFFLNDTNGRKLFGYEGRKRIKAHFTNEAIWKEQLKIYETLLN